MACASSISRQFRSTSLLVSFNALMSSKVYQATSQCASYFASWYSSSFIVLWVSSSCPASRYLFAFSYYSSIYKFMLSTINLYFVFIFSFLYCNSCLLRRADRGNYEYLYIMSSFQNEVNSFYELLALNIAYCYSNWSSIIALEFDLWFY